MDAMREILSVSAVLLLLAAALWWLRRKGLAGYGARGSRGPRGRTLQPVERLHVGTPAFVALGAPGWPRTAGGGFARGMRPARKLRLGPLESRLAGAAEAR